MALFDEMQRRYRDADLPWDDPLPPPELIALAATLPAGRALDLGCGPGRTCIYLASRGWRCDGVDFVPEAIEMARERAAATGATSNFHVAPVTQLDFLEPAYDLAVDIGCLHAQRGDDLDAYRAGLTRLLRKGGRYLLFARLTEEETDIGPRGLPESMIRALFESDFTIDRVEHGSTGNGATQWSSGWFWMTRR